MITDFILNYKPAHLDSGMEIESDLSYYMQKIK